ncbi:MAG: hypothetical protein ACLT16_10505 [[Clostridium] innocuum]
MYPFEDRYHGVQLAEFDLDGLYIVSPAYNGGWLAHTNAQGLRHPKRYSDIQSCCMPVLTFIRQ